MSLADIEEQKRKEEIRTRRWLREHEHEVRPERKRSRSGDSKELDQLLDEFGQLPEESHRMYQLLDEWNTANWPVVYDERHKFVPIQAEDRSVDISAAVLALRVRHVLSFLIPSQQEELFRYYIEHVSWTELRRGNETRQAVHNRLNKAKRMFLRAWLEHAQDDVQLREEDF